MARLLLAALVATSLGGCGLFGDTGPVRVAAIGTLNREVTPLAGALSLPDGLVADATAQGLVSFAADGSVEPGLAERWTVIDGGRSYIFRLREAAWANGRAVRANDVAAIIGQRVRSNRLPMALRSEFAAITSIRGMTTKVIEIQLSRPQPDLLDLLAQPDMAVSRSGGWGPWRVAWSGRTALLTPAPPLAMGTEEAEAESAESEPSVLLWGSNSRDAVAMFDTDAADSVIGGRFEGWPLVRAAGIDNNAIIMDPVQGLFGLAVTSDDGPLGDGRMRDAVAMAIDRDRIVARINAPGWASRLTLRSPQSAIQPIFPSWVDLTLDQRRARARETVAGWRSRNGGAPTIRIAMPDGPGARIMHALIAADLAVVGITARRVPLSASADLRLIDEVAPGSDPAWVLRRLDCGRGLLCDADAASQIAVIDGTTTAQARVSAIQSAEEAIIRFSGFIPIATPLRWSLTSDRTQSLRGNPRARHSLIRLQPSPD
jgi:oligopeptide transport system substrate-binding protein